MKLPNKVSTENLDYTFDFVNRFPAGDAIIGATVTVTSGNIAVSNVAHSGSRVTWWLSGGVPGQLEKFIVEATTAAGRISDEPSEVFISQ